MQSEGSPGTVTVVGEALIDLVPAGGPGMFAARPGGSPFNVAIGLARLGAPVALMARLADTAFGRMLRAHAEGEGVDLHAAVAAPEPATLAVVSLDASAQATYDFYLDHTADWQWTADELQRVPERTTVLHFGSLASWLPPGDERIGELAGALGNRADVLVTYDPNVRPALLGDPAAARERIERSVALAHVVKASRDDIEWLYPGVSIAEVQARWTALGAALTVVTDGPAGAHVRGGGAGFARPGIAVQLADTVGAGDAFMSGLIAGLLRRGLDHPQRLARASPAEIGASVDEAIVVSAMTCERPGADPPTAAEVARWMSQQDRPRAHIEE